MEGKNGLSLLLVGLITIWAAVVPAESQKEGAPTVPIPQSGVSQIFTMEGKFVRAADNNEGYVIMGYQPANRSIGEEWMLLDVGITVRDNVPDFTMTRDLLSIETPDRTNIPLPATP